LYTFPVKDSDFLIRLASRKIFHLNLSIYIKNYIVDNAYAPITKAKLCTHV